MEIQNYEPMKLLGKIEQSNYSYRRSWKTKVTEIDEGVGKLQGNLSTFNKSARWLKKYKSGATSGTRLEKEITSLIKAYNDMSDNADSVTDKDLRQQMAKLDKLFSENEENFNKIGVEKVKGKYKLDSKKFADADEEALSALFEGNNSFMNKIEKIMRKTEASAESAHYSVNERTVTSVMEYKKADVVIAGFMVLAESTGKTLNDSNNLVQYIETLTDDDKEPVKNAIISSLSQFAVNAYKQYEGDMSGNINKLKDLFQKNEGNLKKVGIVFDSTDKKTMSFNPDKALSDTAFANDFNQYTDDERLVAAYDAFKKYMETDGFKTAYNELFGSNDESFGKKAVTYAKDAFYSIVKADKIGVSIDTYA